MDLLSKVQLETGETHFHLLPGRLRLEVPGLLHNQLKAEELARRLASVPGIKVGYVNPVSGRVLLYFEYTQVSLAWLLGEVLQQPRRPQRQSSYPSRLEAGGQQGLRQAVGPHLPAHEPLPKPPSPSETAWHALSQEQILTALQTKTEYGLTEQSALQRLQKYGPNQLADKPRASLLQMLLEPLQGFMNKLLLLAAGVSLLVGEYSDALVIAVIVALQAVIETVQGYRAEKSLAALKELSAPMANVLRSGKLARLPARQLVPGDIILLEAGDRVPADARLLQVSNLTTNEACLTGESLPVVKSTAEITELRLATADQGNMIFAGTSVTSGRGFAAIVATGMNSEMGKIAALLRDVEAEPTVLQRQMEGLGKRISKLIGGSVGVIALINLIQGRPLLEILRTGVSLAVGAIPEGLPAVLTVALAAGVQRMVRRQAVVRRLPAVETLGSTTVICTDKTGTLTKNEMTVKELFANGELYELSGEGYQPEGSLLHRGASVGPDLVPDLLAVLTVGVLCNNAELQQGKNGRWQVIGDPTEGALLTAASKAGLCWEELRQRQCRRREIAFDSARRMMTVVCQDPEGSYHVYVKGAPDTLIEHCSQTLKDGTAVPLDIKTRRKILAANDLMTGKALRVLATAWKNLPPGVGPDDAGLESDLVFSGLVGMADPPRSGVKEAIRKCHSAGVKVVMITGDHQKTAEAMAKKLGILQQGVSITGASLERFSEEELTAQVESIVVYSRTSPDQKLRIVRALKKRGHIVAMTGDGVNDAPAVKEADIGVAMGLSGTDVTREAAGITLSDDNFATIVAGIEEGRTVGDNLAKSVRYVLSGSLGQVLAVFLAAVTGLPAPLLPPQLLWINLVTEGLPAMALTGDPPQVNCMRRPPLRPETRFFDNHGREIVRKGILTGLSTFGVYAGGLELGGWAPSKARTMAFSYLVIGRVFNLFDSRRTRGAALLESKNPYIVPAAGLSTVMLLLTMYFPALRPLFSTVPIGFGDWVLIGLTAGLAGRMDSLFAGKSSHTRQHNPKLLPAGNSKDRPQPRPNE